MRSILRHIAAVWRGASRPAPAAHFFVWLALGMAVLVGGCGGPGEEGTGVQPESVNVGVLQGIDSESVTVNGVAYTRREASVVDGFETTRSADDLRLGMWVEVQGTVDDSGEHGVAQTIRVRPAVRGVVSAASAGGLSIGALDTEVFVGEEAVLDGAASTSDLAPGDVVEVHGPLENAAGDVRASRVERLTAAAAPSASAASSVVLPAAAPYELRGRVSALDTQQRTLTVGRRSVSYAGATLLLRSALANGMMVRVSARSSPQAGQAWAVDRLTADQPLPDNLGFIYVEGYVADFVPAPINGPRFTLEGLAVDATGANNRGALKADGQRVAVLGALVDGVLKAKSVAVIAPGAPVVFILSGAVSSFVSPGEFHLRGVLIDASAAEYVAPATPEGLVNGLSVRVRGPMAGRTLVASRLELLPKP